MHKRPTTLIAYAAAATALLVGVGLMASSLGMPGHTPRAAAITTNRALGAVSSTPTVPAETTASAEATPPADAKPTGPKPKPDTAKATGSSAGTSRSGSSSGGGGSTASRQPNSTTKPSGGSTSKNPPSGSSDTDDDREVVQPPAREDDLDDEDDHDSSHDHSLVTPSRPSESAAGRAAQGATSDSAFDQIDDGGSDVGNVSSD